jgi:catechol 2,3-dioxygenase-like lactoylglutathione lyase family enzyme
MAAVIAHSGVIVSADVPRAIAFWCDVLGFFLQSSFGEPPEFAILRRDDACQMIALARPDAVTPRHHARAGLMDAYFWVDDARAFHEAILARGGRLAQPLEQQSYGVLDFMVETPDGHHIAFGQDLAGEIGKTEPKT